MADTKPDVVLQPNTPVNLYAATGVTVGTQISVQNNSGGDVRLYSGATQPVLGESGSTLVKPGITAKNTAGDTGAWAWCITDGSVQVGEVS